MSMRNHFLAAAMITGLTFALAAPASAHGPGGTGYGWGWGYGGCPGMMMGPDMMGGGMMGSGTMGPGMMGGDCHGMMGPGMMGQDMMQPLRQDLSADDVKHMMEHRLTWQGNPNLKLGKVEEKDADTIVAEIVTGDGSVVQRFQVNRHTGWMQPAQ